MNRSRPDRGWPRNAYTFTHLPLIAGVVLVALGLKKVLEYVSDTEEHTLADPLKGVALAALFGGVVMYLLGHVLFKWITVHTISVVRLATSAALLVAWPLAGKVPALGQLAIVAVLLIAALVVESVVYRGASTPDPRRAGPPLDPVRVRG